MMNTLKCAARVLCIALASNAFPDVVGAADTVYAATFCSGYDGHHITALPQSATNSDTTTRRNIHCPIAHDRTRGTVNISAYVYDGHSDQAVECRSWSYLTGWGTVKATGGTGWATLDLGTLTGLAGTYPIAFYCTMPPDNSVSASRVGYYRVNET